VRKAVYDRDRRGSKGDTLIMLHMQGDLPCPSRSSTSPNDSLLPFPSTTRARQRSGDPRPAIEERYPSKEAYLELVKKAVEALIAESCLLPADLEAIVQQAAQRDDLLMGRKSEVP
jgi:3-oxoacyl-[acyl-carrier-protein] synthase III